MLHSELKIKKGLGRGLSSLIGETKIETTSNKALIGDKFQTNFNQVKILMNNLE